MRSWIEPKKILVTGGAGFIGHHFINYVLSKTNWHIVCLDRLDPAGDLNRLSSLDSVRVNRHRISVCHHDLRAEINEEIARSLVTGRGSFDDKPFDHVVHMAAGSHVDRSILDPVGFVMDNVVGTANLLNFFRKSPGRLKRDGRILYFSTDEVFGPAPKDRSFSEWDRFNPNNPYAAAKAGGEVLCTAFANTYDMPIVVTHTTNVFGERQHPEKFIPLLIKKIMLGETVQIHSDQTKTQSSSRYYIHADNVSSAVMFILEYGKCLDGSDQFGKYNISGEEETSNLHIAELTARILDKPLMYEMVSFSPSRPKHDMRYAVSCEELKALGWEPEVSLEEGIRRTVRYFLDRSV